MPKPETGKKENEELKNQRAGYMRSIERMQIYLNESRFSLNSFE